MPWFMTPYGPQHVIEPGTVDEFERRDYVSLTDAEAADYFAGVAFPDPPSFATEAEVPGIVADAIAAGTGPVAEELRAAYGSRLAASATAYDVASRLVGKSLVVIFRHDDVQASALEYLPVYAAHGLKASWYVATGLIGTEFEAGKPLITAAQLHQIHDAGHEIGSHTMTHAYFNTSNLTEAQRRDEMLGSKTFLEKELGPGYVCETFAYPGNQIKDTEVLDYYIAALTDGPVSTPIRDKQWLSQWRNGYAHQWLDATTTGPNPGATPATDLAKVRATLNTAASVPGGSVAVIQAHNTTEMSAAQLDMMLTELQADPRVAVLTVREWAHFVRTFFNTQDGKHSYWLGRRIQDQMASFSAISTGAVDIATSATIGAPGTGSGVYFKNSTINKYRMAQVTDSVWRMIHLPDNTNMIEVTDGTKVTVRARLIANSLEFFGGPQMLFGTGSPEGVVSGTPGSAYHRTDGAAGQALYVKESGNAAAGWVAAGPVATLPLTTKTSSYTAQTGDRVIVANGASVTVTLPAASGLAGKTYTVKNVNAASATVAVASSGTIDGGANVTLAQWAKGTFVSDGTQWLTV